MFYVCINVKIFSLKFIFVLFYNRILFLIEWQPVVFDVKNTLIFILHGSSRI